MQGFFRGFSAVIFGAVPAQATYFAAYEFGNSIVPRNSGLVGDMATGAIAQLIAGVAFTPVDIVKERLQVRCLSSHHNAEHVELHIEARVCPLTKSNMAMRAPTT